MAKKGAKVKTDAEKAAKFKELAEVRANRALKAIQGLSKLANPNKYKYTDAQVKKLADAFKVALGQCFDAFEGRLTVTQGIEL